MKVLLFGSTGGIGSAIKESCKDFELICPTRLECDLSKSINTNYVDIDAMIYCAGINNPCGYKDLSEENIKTTMQTNLFSFVSLCQQIKFNPGANIVAIGSLYATETKAERLAYTASKHAMHGVVKTLAIEMSKNKIKVNMVSPGFVLTEMTRQNNTEDRISYLEDKIPLGMTLPEDIANMCYYLMFNESITGQNIIIDGGYSLIGI